MKTQDFKGIWIPKEICNLSSLGWTEKIILAEIISLSGENGCYANNEHFAKLLNIRKDSVSKTICRLVKAGYLVSQIKFKQNTKQVEQRILRINYNFLTNKKCSYPPSKNDDIPQHKCQKPLGLKPSDLPAQTPNKEYNRENNIYAQNPYASRKRKTN